MRKFAEQAQPFVSAQMRQLETTGFVTGDTLPDPPAVSDPPPPAPPGSRRSPAPAATSLLSGGRG